MRQPTPAGRQYHDQDLATLGCSPYPQGAARQALQAAETAAVVHPDRGRLERGCDLSPQLLFGARSLRVFQAPVMPKSSRCLYESRGRVCEYIVYLIDRIEPLPIDANR